nr:MAG: hypothetical protein [Lake Baikal virophage 9]
MSEYNFKVPKKADAGIERQLEIALINAQMEDDNEPRDPTRFDSFTVDDGMYEFKCSKDNSVYHVIPHELVKSKLITYIDENVHSFNPVFFARSMKLPLGDMLTLELAEKMFEAFQTTEVNLMITIIYTLFNSC